MRTTVTLDPDVDALLRKVMRERGISFKEALNQAVRAGLAGAGSGRPREYRLQTFRMGQPEVSLDKALSLAAVIEEEEVARKLSLGK